MIRVAITTHTHVIENVLLSMMRPDFDLWDRINKKWKAEDQILRVVVPEDGVWANTWESGTLG